MKVAIGLAAQRQNPLIAKYQREAHEAVIIDQACTIYQPNQGPFHGMISFGRPEVAATLKFGIHSAVGGFHDMPNPGDLLCGALAACLDSTIRIIADRLRIKLDHLAVEVRGEVDVRGTLLVDKSVPVGFQCMHCLVKIKLAHHLAESSAHRLLTAAEHSCVNLQSLLGGVQWTNQLSLENGH